MSQRVRVLVSLRIRDISLSLIFVLAQLRGILRFTQWSLIIDDPLEQGDVNVAKNRIEGSIKSFRDPGSVHPHADYFGQM
jgi:hypothetical protein